MTQTSNLLSLPYIQPSQAQKHVTHNEALRTLDAIVQLSVVELETNTPPAVPVTGTRFVIGAAPSGDWAGHAGEVAVYDQGTWLYHEPAAGWTAYVSADDAWAAFDGANWAFLDVAFPEMTSLLGINTSGDLTNRLAVASDAVLLSHAGGGHQLKVNKASVNDTASLLFQDNFSSRAEMGLAGEDAFSLKVSTDGSAWSTVLRADPVTGIASFPNGGVRPRLEGPLVIYVDPVLGTDSGVGTATGTGAYATIAHAINQVLRMDGGGQQITIQLADGTHTFVGTIVIEQATVGLCEIQIVGNSADNTLVHITGVNTLFDVRGARLCLTNCKLSTTGGGSSHVVVSLGGQASFDTVDFGAADEGQIEAEDGAIRIVGNTRISASARFHVRLSLGARLKMDDVDYTLTGTPDFDSSFLMVGMVSIAWVSSVTFTGLATGRRYYVYDNGMLTTGGKAEDFLPGDEAGIDIQGGIYN